MISRKTLGFFPVREELQEEYKLNGEDVSHRSGSADHYVLAVP